MKLNFVPFEEYQRRGGLLDQDLFMRLQKVRYSKDDYLAAIEQLRQLTRRVPERFEANLYTRITLLRPDLDARLRLTDLYKAVNQTTVTFREYQRRHGRMDENTYKRFSSRPYQLGQRFTEAFGEIRIKGRRPEKREVGLIARLSELNPDKDLRWKFAEMYRALANPPEKVYTPEAKSLNISDTMI